MNKRELTVTKDFDPIVGLVVHSLPRARSRRPYRRALDDFLSWCGHQERPGLKKATLQAYKRYCLDAGLAPSTVNQRLAAVKKLATEAADNGLLDPVLAAGIGRVKGVKSETLPAGRHLTLGKIAAMFAACANDPTAAGVRDAALLALLRLGLHRAEVAGLQVDGVDLDAGTVRVSGKGRKQRELPLMNGAAQVVADWMAIQGDDPGALVLARLGQADALARCLDLAHELREVLARLARSSSGTGATAPPRLARWHYSPRQSAAAPSQRSVARC